MHGTEIPLSALKDGSKIVAVMGENALSAKCGSNANFPPAVIRSGKRAENGLRTTGLCFMALRELLYRHYTALCIRTTGVCFMS